MTALKVDMCIMQKEKKQRLKCDPDSELTLGDKVDGPSRWVHPQHTQLCICALRPFLSNERRRRLDDAEKILRVMRVLPFIRKSGLF